MLSIANMSLRVLNKMLFEAKPFQTMLAPMWLLQPVSLSVSVQRRFLVKSLLALFADECGSMHLLDMSYQS